MFDFVDLIQTLGVRSVVLYCSCLSWSTQKPFHPGDQGAQHKGRGQAQQVWADELEPPGLWMESHTSCNIDRTQQVPSGWMMERLAEKKMSTCWRTVWAVAPLRVPDTYPVLSISRMIDVEPALKQMARSLSGSFGVRNWKNWTRYSVGVN